MFLFLLIAVALIAACTRKKKKPLRANECPICHKDTLETRQKFFGGSYRRCKRWSCPYDERKVAQAQEEERQRQARYARDRKEAYERAERANINYERERYERRQAESDGRSL